MPIAMPKICAKHFRLLGEKWTKLTCHAGLILRNFGFIWPVLVGLSVLRTSDICTMSTR